MAEATKNETTKVTAPATEEYVTIKLPITLGETQEDEVVWVNDRRFIIQRGVPVDVPMSVALILQQKEEQEARAYERQKKLAH